MRAKILYLLLLSFGLQWALKAQDLKAITITDSVPTYQQWVKDKENYTYTQRLHFAQRARALALIKGTDSTILNTTFSLANLYWNNKDYTESHLLYHKNLKRILKLKDSTNLAKVYFNIGNVHRMMSTNDSAFYYFNTSQKLYKALNNPIKRAGSLLNLSTIQRIGKDYIASEITIFEALKILETVKQTNYINFLKSLFYNNLGLVYSNLEQYDKSIEYQLRALGLKEELEGDHIMSIISSKTNLAVVYRKSKQYDKAIQYYSELITDTILKKKRPAFYAVILSSYGESLYLNGDTKQLPYLYHKALKLCDSVGDRYRKKFTMRKLSEYYFDKAQLDSARYYAREAKILADQFNIDDILESLLLLTKVETDSLAALHARTYIKLNDSIVKNERLLRNKFARIAFETDEIQAEKDRVTRQKQLYLSTTVGLIATLLLLYIVITQRTKNRKLQFVQEQQRANEEIYNLMLTQQDKIEEGRTAEKKRISQELHDGILGRLFGTRINLDSLNSQNTKEAKTTRGKYISQLKGIEQDIRQISHDLNTDFIKGTGFIDLVKTLIETQTKAYTLSYDFNNDSNINWERVPNKKKIHVYRILQESMQNIYKHAKAKHIDIGINKKNDLILVRVKDDGIGFNTEKAKKGIGLKNMISRLKDIKGHLDINSNSQGTTMLFSFPS